MSGAAAAGFMDLDEIKALIEAMQASDLAEMEVSRDGWTLRMVRRTQRAAPVVRSEQCLETPLCEASDTVAPDETCASQDQTAVRAPLTGIVHLTPSPGAPPFVQPGQTVAAGATLCLIEAMKMFNAVRAERDGTVEAVLVSAEAEVEAGQPLMRIV
jgi:acetyl-CoA carboxylase biotin carboxyl carrier protein